MRENQTRERERERYREKGTFQLTYLNHLQFIKAQGSSKYRPEAYTCRLLNTKFVDSQPWLEYPIIFAPVTRGKLTIWSGTSTLPGSEFKCWAGKNGTGAILLDFANFADKLEWTYYGKNALTMQLSSSRHQSKLTANFHPNTDKNQGITFHGISVSHRENIVYKVYLDNRQTKNYLECNKIRKIEFSIPNDEEPLDIRSTCKDCKGSTIALINNQLKEILKVKLNDYSKDGLYWHLTHLISSQHFSGPISLSDDSN